MVSVYEAAGGEAGLQALAAAWHARVLADEVVSHAFSHGFHPQHTERLAAYWGEALGGPAAYSDGLGTESVVVRMHSGNGPHEDMDRRAIACFDQAMDDVGIGAAAPLRAVLHDYFAWATVTSMAAYHRSADDVPDGSGPPALVMGGPGAPLGPTATVPGPDVPASSWRASAPIVPPCVWAGRSGLGIR